MKRTKKFLIAFVVAVIYFAISLVIQYNLPVVPITRAIISFSILSGIIGFSCTIGIINIKPKNLKKFSIDYFILRLLMAFLSFSILVVLSTSGIEIFMNIYIVSLLLTMVWTVYMAFKDLISKE